MTRRKDGYWISFGYGFIAALLALPLYFVSQTAATIVALIIFVALMAAAAPGR